MSASDFFIKDKRYIIEMGCLDILEKHQSKIELHEKSQHLIRTFIGQLLVTIFHFNHSGDVLH